MRSFGIGRAALKVLVLASVVITACAPAAAPSPTAAPAKPAEAPKPAAPAPAAPAPAAASPAAAPPAAGASPAAVASPAGAPAAAAAAPKPSPQAAPAPTFNEQAVADFYRGKTVRIIVGYSAGGGFDTYSRVIGRQLGRFIPGNPNVIVENMPGAGGMLAANNVYNVAPKDGTVIGHISGALILEQLFKTSGVEFDMGKFRHLAVPVSESYMMIVTKSTGITKFEETVGPNGKQVKIGAVPAGTTEHAPILTRDLLGSKIQLASGFKGTADVRLAIQNGEVQGFFNTWQSVKITNRAEVDSGEWQILMQFNDKPMADLPGRVPTILDVTTNEEHRKLLLYGTSYLNRFGFDLVAAPEVPTDRAAALEVAMRKTFADSEFLADAEKSKLEIGPLFGADIEALVKETLGMPESMRSQLQKVMKPA